MLHLNPSPNSFERDQNAMTFFSRPVKAVVLTVFMAGSLVAGEVPNVVIIYGDDVGYADIGVNGAAGIPTPNIDRLATEGLNFSDGHCSAATCTPSRFSMLTGVHAFRHNVNVLSPNGNLAIPLEYKTLPQLFKQGGYATGMVGKWHLGFGLRSESIDWNGELKPGPMEIGFESVFLLPNTNDRVPCVYVDGHRVLKLDLSDPIYVGETLEAVTKEGSTAYPDARADNPEAFYQSVVNGIGRIGYTSGGEAALWDDFTMAEVFVERAKAFVAANKDKPFFLYFSSQDIHYPYTPNDQFQGKSEQGKRGDAMVQLDWSVGELLETLDEHGLRDNTIVIFTSDNGPINHNDRQSGVVGLHTDKGAHDASGKWRGGKFQVFEGGTRVPFIVRWPGKVEAGTTSDATVSQIDFMASFANLLDMELQPHEAKDSRDVLPALLGQSPDGVEVLVEECRGPAVRRGPWKYIAAYTGPWTQAHDPKVGTLFNLDDDPGEQQNVIDAHPGIAKEMRQLLNEVKTHRGVRNL